MFQFKLEEIYFFCQHIRYSEKYKAHIFHFMKESIVRVCQAQELLILFDVCVYVCGIVIQDWSGSREFHLGNIAHMYSSQ